MIECKNIWKTYGSGEATTIALKNVFLKIEEGDFVVITGPSGCGKSTLLHILGLLDTPTKGEVYINDILENRIKKVQEAGFDVLKKEEIKEQFDVVIDAAGMDTMMNYEPSFIEGFKYLKKDGVLINIGTYFHPISFVPSA